MTWHLEREAESENKAQMTREYCWKGGWTRVWIDVYVTDDARGRRLSVEISWREGTEYEVEYAHDWPASLLPELLPLVMKAQARFGVKVGWSLAQVESPFTGER